MDPFSLAAGVAGLVTLVAKITKLVTNYFHGVRRAIEAANELLDELNALRLTLNHLENLLRNDKKDAFSSTSILVKSTDACSNKLTMLHSKLQDNVKQPLQKLRWPLNASFHHEILQHIRNYTQSIHFALTLDGSVLLSKTFEEVVEVLSNQVGVVEHLKQLQSGANYTHTIAKDTRQIVQNLDAASKREEILDWISLAKPEQKHYEMRLRRLEGTGQWLLHYPSFKRWYDESSNAANNLWCHGIPGSGKSILASLVIDHIRYASAESPIQIAHIYFDYKDQEFQSLEQIIASLLKQIAGARSQIPTAVASLHKRLKAQGKSLQQQDLVHTLSVICGKQRRTYFVIDALDECDPRFRRKFIKFLHDSEEFASILVTSRPYPNDVAQAFGTWPQIEIKADSFDLRTYISNEFDQNVWHHDINDSFREKAADAIIYKAKDMFLLAALHIKTVLIEPTEGQMADALDRLPLSLDAAFGETLRRIKAQGDSTRELALNCLMWISHAKRPLTVEELSDALAITKTYTCSIPFNVKYRPLQKQITDSCHGLITVDQKSKIARLAHYSIHEYLRGSQVQTFADGEKIIAEVCIAYQMLEPFESECLWEESEILKMLDDCPFYAYAARKWGHHVRVADDTGVNQIALNFLRADSQRARSYQVFQFSLGRRAEYWDPDEATSCNGLHLAAMFGLTDIVRKYLPDYAIDTPTVMGTTALIKAASSGFSDLVTLFLSMNADPNRNNWYGTALHCAAEADQTATIETLLDAGVDVNLQDEHNRVPLFCATQSGHTAAMRTLLDRGADVNFYNGTCTVLYGAVQSREGPEVVQLLLDYRADPNIISIYRCAPLHAAAMNSASLIAQMLLDHGAKVDTPDVYGQTALHIAAMLGEDQLIRLFLDRGATIDAQSRDGSTALHLAAEQGRGKSVRLLLEEGAKLELTNDRGYTPLQVAAINNETEVLQLLI